MEVPGIRCTFPQHKRKFADFGQNLRKFCLAAEKLAVKFAEAGNLSAVKKNIGSLKSGAYQRLSREVYFSTVVIQQRLGYDVPSGWAGQVRCSATRNIQK